MQLRRIATILTALALQLALSGCFVTSSSLPQGSGPSNDEAIVGDWRGLDADSGKEENVFIHIQKPDPNKPLRVVFIENRDFSVYEMHTTRVGTRTAFAAKVTHAGEDDDDVPEGYVLGYYELRGNELKFYLLDAEKVRGLINAGKVKGNPGKGRFDFANLTGTPSELATFLSSPDGWASRVDDPARMVRLNRPQ